MRTFEIGLILVNALALGLGFKKQPKAVWWGAAVANLAVLCVHALAEGLRYQMAFSYVFVLLLAVFTLFKTGRRFSAWRTPRPLKVIMIGLSVVLLGLTAFLAYALPVFSLPAPTGSYAVGIQYFHFTDASRADPFLDRSPRPRELMVKVYYPAQPDAAKPPAPYFHHSPALIRLFTAGYQLPEFMFDHLNLVKTHSKEGLALSDQQQRYPLVLFSHGAGASMEVQTAQGEDLASHGYIVAAIDHPYVSAATVFPDRIVSAREATTDFNTVEPAEIITQIMADDASFVLTQLGAMNDGSIASAFQGRMDMDQVGVIGHSVGGAAAYNLALNDPRVKAAIDLDGVVYITPKAGAPAAPLLMLANDKYHVQAIQKRENLMVKFDDIPAQEREIQLSIYGSEAAYRAAYTKAQLNLAGLIAELKRSGALYTILGSDHMKFTDIGLFIGSRSLRELIGIGGKTDPARCLAITEAVTLAFFDQHLKGDPQAAPDGLLKVYPELEKVDLK